jgi:hypothetical protein
MDLTAMFAMFVIFGVPTLSVSAVVLGIATLWYRYKVAELETRAFEAKTRVAQARLLAGAPEWVDPANPAEVEAWSRAHGEVLRAAARAQLRIGDT